MPQKTKLSISTMCGQGEGADTGDIRLQQSPQCKHCILRTSIVLHYSAKASGITSVILLCIVGLLRKVANHHQS